MIWNISELSALYLSRATAIFVADCCQFGLNWIYGLKMKLMACAGLVGGTTEQSCPFPDHICYYQWYKTLLNCQHHTPAVTQPFLLLIPSNVAIAGFLGWKWSFWPVLAWSAVQWIKSFFFHILYGIIDDMKHFQTVWITPQPCHSHFCCWLLPIWP